MNRKKKKKNENVVRLLIVRIIIIGNKWENFAKRNCVHALLQKLFRKQLYYLLVTVTDV